MKKLFDFISSHREETFSVIKFIILMIGIIGVLVYEIVVKGEPVIVGIFAVAILFVIYFIIPMIIDKK